jgi:hypothetical protein
MLLRMLLLRLSGIGLLCFVVDVVFTVAACHGVALIGTLAGWTGQWGGRRGVAEAARARGMWRLGEYIERAASAVPAVQVCMDGITELQHSVQWIWAGGER